MLIGSSQQRVSLAEMQPLHRNQAEVEDRLLRGRESGAYRGAMVLATCNRFEVLVDTDHSAEAVREAILPGCEVPLHAVTDQAAVEHLIRVATGLESLAA